MEASLADGDFDADIEFKTEFTIDRDTMIALGFRPSAAY